MSNAGPMNRSYLRSLIKFLPSLTVVALIFIIYWLILGFVMPANYPFFDCGMGNGLVNSGCIHNRILLLLRELSFLFIVASLAASIMTAIFQNAPYLRLIIPLTFLILAIQLTLERYASLLPPGTR